MRYREGIMGIPKQFEYRPEIQHKEKIQPFKRIVVLGMGGSRLAADILNMYRPDLDIHIHSDYDLPLLSVEALEESIIIANSYSGNTEEVISGTKMAIEKNLNLVCVSTDGELAELANKHGLPLIVLPSQSDLPPRLMIGYDLMALSEILKINTAGFDLCRNIDISKLEIQAKNIAAQIKSDLILVYTAERFNELGYVWKVILNETANALAFHNRFPEVNHNEIEAFQNLPKDIKIHCLMLRDNIDQRISRRMDVTAELLKEQGVSVSDIMLEGDLLSQKIITYIILAHYVAVELAEKAGVDPASDPVIADLKKQVG